MTGENTLAWSLCDAPLIIFMSKSKPLCNILLPYKRNYPLFIVNRMIFMSKKIIISLNLNLAKYSILAGTNPFQNGTLPY